ncbi:hypothetical protein FSP39_017108 [Pinctada imbricata]|uniref:Uncharacterized protein n=1 Tax=Pinctada imbricata TaxID=66713 RepID=A0AA88YF34_PINIB|nr:hypothetical protein FSP39_017108 [Pinctada imbricata]
MAESSPNEEGKLEIDIKTKAKEENSQDEELDDLLESALKDFEKQDVKEKTQSVKKKSEEQVYTYTCISSC